MNTVTKIGLCAFLAGTLMMLGAWLRDADNLRSLSCLAQGGTHYGFYPADACIDSRAVIDL